MALRQEKRELKEAIRSSPGTNVGVSWVFMGSSDLIPPLVQITQFLIQERGTPPLISPPYHPFSSASSSLLANGSIITLISSFWVREWKSITKTCTFNVVKCYLILEMFKCEKVCPRTKEISIIILNLTVIHSFKDMCWAPTLWDIVPGAKIIDRDSFSGSPSKI